ncbi:uncharacterized protein LOC18010478 [Eutrema salsugineum]|uniref:uncharacterized protein LOC18010478 n=1 Tax=Eutrema salsugineum TaxID=72664 RepID=UPI000CED2E83|nr:uncharacterized protein LOC18010478 [Eutrema salsugineum]
MEQDSGLPTRLFATDRNPINRINVYSRLDLLTHLHHTLKRTPAFEFIRASCFGPLFDLPALRCPISCKLIHALLTRQLVTKKEFGTVTRLPCGEYPQNYDPDYQPTTPKNPGDYWRELIGDDPKTTLADIAALLRNEPDMPTGRKIRLALLIIVDGVLIANSQGSTINEASVELFRQQMPQATFKLQGFPLALQLVAFRACPLLPSKLPKDSDHPTLLEWTTVPFSKGNALSHSDVIEIEFSDALVVHPLIPVDQPHTEGWGDWDDEVKDKKVDHLELLVKQGHVFHKSNWHGGDSTEALTTHNPTISKREHQKHILNRRTKMSSPPGPYSLRSRQVTPKKPPNRKQKRIHDYLKPLPRDLQSQVNILSKQESPAFHPQLTLVDQYRSESHEDVPTYPIHTELDNLMDVDEIDPQVQTPFVRNMVQVQSTYSATCGTLVALSITASTATPAY